MIKVKLMIENNYFFSPINIYRFSRPYIIVQVIQPSSGLFGSFNNNYRYHYAGGKLFNSFMTAVPII